MFRAFLIACILLASSVAMGAEATYNRAFYVSGEVSTVVKWIIANEDAVVKSTRCEIVSRDGDLVRVKKSTPKGTFEFTLRERVSMGDNEAVYSTMLEKVHQGKLVDEQIIVKITKDDGKVKMSLYSKAKVDDPRIRFVDVAASLSASARGFERLMTNRF